MMPASFRRLAPIVGAACLLMPTRGAAADASAAIDAWITSQRDLRTWSADFTQTRTLKSLTKPLVSAGKAWFASPDRFRWETFSPAPTVAVRDADQMLVIYPRLKRAERYSLGTSGPMGDLLSVLDAGFPRDRKTFDAKFRLISATVTEGRWEFRMEPARHLARKFVPRLAVWVSADRHELMSFEITFTDGSRMHTTFTGAIVNQPIPDEVFRPRIPPDVTLTEPLHQ